MLSLDFLLPSASHMRTYGQLRAGYLDHEAENLAGKKDRSLATVRTDERDEAILNAEITEDPATGELRLVTR